MDHGTLILRQIIIDEVGDSCKEQLGTLAKKLEISLENATVFGHFYECYDLEAGIFDVLRLDFIKCNRLSTFS